MKNKKITPFTRKSIGKNPTPTEIREEIICLRQKCTALFMRGDYAECIKTIEQNIRFFYFRERWPENFFSMLRLHQKCYPSLSKAQSHEEYMTTLLCKNGIPSIFTTLLRGSDSSIVWSAEYFKDLAIVSEGQADYQSALGYADLVLKIEPSSSSAHLIRGWILDDMGREREAMDMFEQAIELDHENRHALNSLSMHYLKHNPKKALEYIEEAILQDPNEAAYHATKSNILLALGSRTEALSAIELAITLNPYNADYFYQKGELYIVDGREVSAIAQYRLAIALDETHLPSLTRLVAFSMESQPDLALSYVNTIVTMEPENIWAALTRAQLLQHLGENTAAIKQYTALLEADPGCAQAYAGRGVIYMMDLDSQAIHDLCQAVELCPENANYHIDLARAYQKLDMLEESIASYRFALELDQTLAKAWAELGHIYTESNPHEAINCFSKAIELAPENAYYHASKGELLVKTSKNLDQAIDCLNKACKLAPFNAQIHLSCGMLLEQQGNIISAVDCYKTAVGLNPEKAEQAFAQLAKIYQKFYPEMALKYINSALHLNNANGELYYLKGTILLELGDNSRAIDALRRSIPSGGEKSSYAMMEIAEIVGGDSPGVALYYINRAIELCPDNMEYHCARAHLLLQTGAFDRALAQYKQILKKDPAAHEALFGIGRIMSTRKDPAALQYFEQAITLAPDRAAYHAEKADFLAADSTTYAQAINEYATAIALDKQLWQVILKKAKLLDAHGDRTAAMDEYRRVLLVNRKSAEAASRLGMMLAEHSPHNALIYLDHAIRLQPDHYLLYAWRSRVLLALGNDDAAIDELHEAVSRGGDAGEAYYAMAEILREKMPETALHYIHLAIDKCPHQASYHLLCGDIYADGLYNYDQATSHYKKACEIDPDYHYAYEKLCELHLMLGDMRCEQYLNTAKTIKPGCPYCQYLSSLIYEELHNHIAGAIRSIEHALQSEPDNLKYRERLVLLLHKKHVFLRIPIEKYKLERLRRQLQLPHNIPAAPPLDDNLQDTDTDTAASFLLDDTMRPEDTDDGFDMQALFHADASNIQRVLDSTIA